jgi:hypothetical protein
LECKTLRINADSRLNFTALESASSKARVRFWGLIQHPRQFRLIIDSLSEAVVDALMCALTHVILGFLRRGKGAVGRYRMNACVEIDVTFPSP